MSPYIEVPKDLGATLKGYVEFPPFPNRPEPPSASTWAVGSVALDGLNDDVTWSTQVENFNVTNAFTIAIRLYISSNTTCYAYSRQNGTPRGVAWYIVAGTSNLLPGAQVLQDGANNLRTDFNAENLLVNTWTSLFLINDGANTSTSLTIHLNTTTPAQTQAKNGAPTDSTSTIASFLGRRNGGTFPFPGWMRCFGVYSKAATLTERTNWHNACVALQDPTNLIANGVHFYSFNTDASDSIGTNNGSLENGAFIDSFVG